MLAFIGTQFPIAHLSAESYKEREANNGQTLTRLDKCWGRKPLVPTRAAIVGILLPAIAGTQVLHLANVSGQTLKRCTVNCTRAPRNWNREVSPRH